MSSGAISDSNHILPIVFLVKEWLSGGLANAVTSAFLNPLDIAKTRIQSQNLIQGGSRFKNLSNSGALRSAIIQLYSEGGVLGIWSPGLSASMWREMFSGLRAGMYVPVRNYVNHLTGFNMETDNKNEIPLFNKIVAAMITGTMGSLVANPVDVVKVRLMINPKAYPSSWGGVFAIYRTDGWSGLYRGIGPSTARAACIAAGELATYDHAKSLLKKYFGKTEGVQLHLMASVITGVVATTVAAPFDVIKTRAMNSSSIKPIAILRETIAKEGVQALLKGWVPAYCRLGPHALICFPIFEQLRLLFGLPNI